MGKGPVRTIVWYRRTVQEARALADGNPKFKFLGKGYNKNFPHYWAVQIKDIKDES